jgi:hypothetical protein
LIDRNLPQAANKTAAQNRPQPSKLPQPIHGQRINTQITAIPTNRALLAPSERINTSRIFNPLFLPAADSFRRFVGFPSSDLDLKAAQPNRAHTPAHLTAPHRDTASSLNAQRG